MIKKVFLAILLLGTADASANKSDDTFQRCMANTLEMSEQTRCIQNRTKDFMQELKVAYEKLAATQRFSGWNKSLDMKSGNLRAMYEDWLKFRERYCSYYTLIMTEEMHSSEYNNAQCMLDLTRTHAMDMQNLLTMSNSTMYDI